MHTVKETHISADSIKIKYVQLHFILIKIIKILNLSEVMAQDTIEIS